MNLMWEETVGDVHAKCEHEGNTYHVTVTHNKGKSLTNTFKQNFPNYLGMDSIDMGIACVMAEDLAKELEKHENCNY